MKAIGLLISALLFAAVPPVHGQSRYRTIGETYPPESLVRIVAAGTLSEGLELTAGLAGAEPERIAGVAVELSRSALGGTPREEVLLVHLCSALLAAGVPGETRRELPEALVAVLAPRLNSFDDPALRRFVLLGVAFHPQPHYASLLAERGRLLVHTFEQERSRLSPALRAEARAYLLALRRAGNRALATFAAGIAEHSRSRPLVVDARRTGRLLLR